MQINQFRQIRVPLLGISQVGGYSFNVERADIHGICRKYNKMEFDPAVLLAISNIVIAILLIISETLGNTNKVVSNSLIQILRTNIRRSPYQPLIDNV